MFSKKEPMQQDNVKGYKEEKVPIQNYFFILGLLSLLGAIVSSIYINMNSFVDVFNAMLYEPYHVVVLRNILLLISVLLLLIGFVFWLKYRSNQKKELEKMSKIHKRKEEPNYYNRFKERDVNKLDYSAIALSIKEVKDYIPQENSVLIRIWDNLHPENKEPFKNEELYDDIITFHIPDNRTPRNEYSQASGDWYTMPTLDEYKELSDFIQKYKDKNFVIHCSQGESRSSACMYYICDVKEDYKQKHSLDRLGIYSPNPNLYFGLHGKYYEKNINNIQEFIVGGKGLDNI